MLVGTQRCNARRSQADDTAVAFEILARLDAYEVRITECCARWPDYESYSDACRSLEQVRLFSGAMPRLSVPVVGLVMAHAELVVKLSSNDAADECRRHVLMAVDALRQRLMERTTSDRQGSPTSLTG